MKTGRLAGGDYAGPRSGVRLPRQDCLSLPAVLRSGARPPAALESCAGPGLMPVFPEYSLELNDCPRGSHLTTVLHFTDTNAY